METKDITEPTEVAKMYIKGTFIFDCIAAFPYSVTYPPYIALRYLKLMRMGEYNGYIRGALSDLLLEKFNTSREKLSNILDMYGLTTLLVFTSHMFSVLWMLMGRNGLANG